MQKTSSFSFLISMLLHGIIVFAIVSYPATRMVDLKKRESYQVSLVVGTPKSGAPVSKVIGPQPKPEVKPTPPPKTETPKTPPKAEVKPVVQEAPKAVAVPAKVVKAPEAKPAPKPAPVAKPAPEPPKEVAKATPAPEKKPAPVAKPAPEPPKSAVFSALADLEALSKEETANSGNGTSDGDGGSALKDVYIAQIMLIVQEEWSFPTYSRENYITQVLVQLDANGTILDRRIETSSGRADFDASAINALDRLVRLPEPPNRELQILTLVFNSAQ